MNSQPNAYTYAKCMLLPGGSMLLSGVAIVRNWSQMRTRMQTACYLQEVACSNAYTYAKSMLVPGYMPVDFAALNKSDRSREKFISRFGSEGKLVEFDYDAYHLRLIADKVEYEFPEGSVHEHMAKYYNCDYEESKRRSFQYLYGGIPIEVWQLNPFFSSVYDYVNNLWNIYKEEHFIKSDIYSREIKGSNFNANKLFNYYIQLLETETNVVVIKKVRQLMNKYKSKFILYSYDSFLFDMHIEDGLPFLKELKDVLENNKFPTKVAWGKNYDDLVDITEKF